MASISSFNDLFGTDPFLFGDEDPLANGLENSADYVDSQSSHMDVNNGVCSAPEEMKQSPVYEELCDFTVASDCSDSTLPPACVEKKHKGKIKLKDEQLDLQCGWRDCDHRTSNLDQFVRHVSFHLPHLEVKLKNDQEGVYVCLWEQCGFECADSNEITRHVNFHSYHTKLKCIGSNILARSGLPICTLQVAGKKVVPDLPHAFECCWQTCEETFSSPQFYFNHVDMHVYCNPRGRKVKGVPCQWRGCMSKSTYQSVYKLADHIRIHTKEKLVGCPVCGGLFANRTKFSYHCKHQVPLELQGPSGELVQKQIIKAQNRHKCPFCGQSFSCPSNLCVHIRYRHLDSRPFRCSFCVYRAKTHWDMKRHLNKHCPNPLYHCVEEQCNFSCRSAYGLRRHYEKHHLGCDQPQYCCHICDSLFRRGSLLTHHLYIKHSICQPSGQYRFRYKQDEDGLFRLLTVDTRPKKVTQNASQPLCSKEDDPLKQKAGGGEVIVSMIEYDDKETVVSSEDTETTKLYSLPPGSYKLLEALSFIE
ncbi:hypothetical protein B7P43_G16451 [Cryptotermes secundus]|uniref:C2H2-type domain-containing protein n=2 Tax=Cryptotermes secundus TaxID=105785 RepID=A0A2J7QCY1_9NEOP|nr:histone H4 transcription factor isoform X2 [Cryptotermes secundus]XP_023714682.1 histone H4 transcription factor isoform X2 [Cryptotermes secundus]PNF26442.1 hypothetical protein B7P43_G16451 [Cryptotermes secundus]